MRKLDLNEVREFIEAQSPETKIYIGCDSERMKIDKVWYADYITAIVVHINGNNGCKLFGEVVRERDYDQKLEYEFINAFPISITSMPVSYEASSLLKCSVSLSYIRYILIPTGTDPKHRDAGPSPSAGYSDPALEAAFNAVNNPLFGAGFVNAETERRTQAALNPLSGSGFGDSRLESAFQALNQSDSDTFTSLPVTNK